MEEFSLKLPASAAYLELVGQFVTFMAHQVGFAARDAARIRLAVDEACANVLAHSCAEGQVDHFHVVCQADGALLTVRVQDSGPPFDLGAVPEPDIHAPLEKRKIGGLGLYFMRQIMDSVELLPLAGGKEIVLTKRVPAEETRNDADAG